MVAYERMPRYLLGFGGQPTVNPRTLMTTFYNQPLTHTFGSELQTLLTDPKWTQFDVAVAWVRRSGMQYLQAPLTAFLGRGGTARFIVGVDIENTSIEGLEDLLALENAGTLATFVYHNESAPTYHPKVYLLEGNGDAYLTVGSNNLTQSGLFTNTEAGLQMMVQSGDAVVQQARDALDTWSDINSPLVKRLDQALLNDLKSLGYVLSESTLRKRRAANRSTAGVGTAGTQQKLFGTQVVSAPPPPATGTATQATHAASGGTGTPPTPASASFTAPTGAAAPGSTLYMRVRRAHPVNRRTQIQIPIRLMRTMFFKGIAQLISAQGGDIHAISYASAGGRDNTVKVELPEIANMSDPVLELERTAAGVRYRAYDATSQTGQQIMAALKQGMNVPAPYNTVLTLPSNPARSTWYRFV